MAERKDKKAVKGESMPEAQIRALLQYQPESGENPDFHRLLRAYRGMTAEDFARFLTLFRQAGHDLEASDPHGRTIRDVISQHRHGGEYLAALDTNRG